MRSEILKKLRSRATTDLLEVVTTGVNGIRKWSYFAVIIRVWLPYSSPP